MRIGNITGSKNPRYLCTGSIPLRNDIAYFIRFKIGFEDIRIRLMTDSQEKSIYGQCITFFIRFTPTFYKAYTFYPILTEQTNSIMFK